FLTHPAATAASPLSLHAALPILKLARAPLARADARSARANHLGIVAGIVDAEGQILKPGAKVIALATAGECPAVNRLDARRGKFTEHRFHIVALHLKTREGRLELGLHR